MQATANFVTIAAEDYKKDARLIRGEAFGDTDMSAWMRVHSIKGAPLGEKNGSTSPMLWHRDQWEHQTDKKGHVNSRYSMTLRGAPTAVFDDKELTLDAPPFAYQSRPYRQIHREQQLSTPSFANTEPHLWNKGDLSERQANPPGIGIKQNDILKLVLHQDDTPVHFINHTKYDRILESIVFGSELEIRKICSDRGDTYGRSVKKDVGAEKEAEKVTAI